AFRRLPGRPRHVAPSPRRSPSEARRARRPRARALRRPPASLRVPAHREGPRPLSRRRLPDPLGRPLDGRPRRPADRARAPRLRQADHAGPRLPRVRRASRRARHASPARTRAEEEMESAATAAQGGAPMIATQSVDPSVSRTPLPLDATDLATICVLCSQNCGIRVDVAGGRIVAVRADERNPITTGYICNKGFSIPNYERHAERLAHPLKRLPDGGFERVGWDVAIAEIAARLADIRARHTPRAIGLVGIAGQGEHMDPPYLLG